MDIQILLLSHCFCFPSATASAGCQLPTCRQGDGGFCEFCWALAVSGPAGAVAALR